MKTVLLLIVLIFAATQCAEGQQSKVYHVGVITSGGVWYSTIDGFRAGLSQLGLHEGKQFTLSIRETRGDTKLAEAAARDLQQQKVDLIYTTQTSVTIPAKRVTADIPIVFCAGSDPVVLGLVESLAKPGGRLTGIYSRDGDLTAKRMEILKEMVPKLRRLVTFYDPRNPVPAQEAIAAREAARRMGIQLLERHFTSLEELQASIQALKAGEVDAIFEVSDAMVDSQDGLIIETARAQRLPSMFVNQNSASKGGLVSYSVSYLAVGRLSAKYVQRIIAGAKPKDLPVEGVDKIELVINNKTAKQLGLTIPPNVLARADKVIR